MPDLQDTLYRLVPEDGSAIGNQSLREKFLSTAKGASEADFEAARDALVEQGRLAKGKGRGGSVRRAEPAGGGNGFALQAQEKPAELPLSAAKSTPRKPVLKAADSGDEAQILSYRYGDKRKNNPHVGMVDTASDSEESETRWAFDPHIDPALNFDPARAGIETLIDDALASGDEAQMRAALEQLKRMQTPYLNWTGKAERTSFEVDTVWGLGLRMWPLPRPSSGTSSCCTRPTRIYRLPSCSDRPKPHLNRPPKWPANSPNVAGRRAAGVRRPPKVRTNRSGKPHRKLLISWVLG